MFRRRPSLRRGLVNQRAEIEGTYALSGPLMLNGEFKGEIVSTGVLIVGPKADLRVGQAVISGEVVGTVQASEGVALKGGALSCEGHCRMTKVAAETPPARDLSVVHVQR